MWSPIEKLLAEVPEKALWQDLKPDLRSAFEQRAQENLERERREWGLAGLEAKERVLFAEASELIVKNVDRVLSVVYATETPEGFRMARDVASSELRQMLLRIYLHRTSARADMLSEHPDFKGWDGLPVTDVALLDHVTMADMARYLGETEERLRRLDDAALTPLEWALRDKSYFITRAGKHFTRPHVANSAVIGYSTLYNLSTVPRLFPNEWELLEAFNASMFAEFRDVSKGALESFQRDISTEFSVDWLSAKGMSPRLVTNVLKLASLYQSRVMAHPHREKPCTIYSPEERAANWDAFTASMMSNADGKETMDVYAVSYAEVAERRAAEMRVLAQEMIDVVFPSDDPALNPEQRKIVANQLAGMTQPAAVLEILDEALQSATGSPAAGEKLKAVLATQPMVGGYEDDEKMVRPGDEATILEMWSAVHQFIQREYGGYAVDIAALIPKLPIMTATSGVFFASGGNVSLGLKVALPKANLYSTLLHEVKHAIDQNSHAAVEGAAWEGAGTSVERQVWPLFIRQAMSGSAVDQAAARLLKAQYNVRYTATTDATLQIYLRTPESSDLDSFAFAERIADGYGYRDPDDRAVRATRANAGTQYLQYDYGLVVYQDLLSYLQAGIGPAPRVDAYLLQACGMPSPKKSQESIDKLARCIKERRA